jgi:hypothetical protein
MCADASRCQGLDTDAASNAAGSTQAGLRLDVSRHGSAAVIAVAGELDLASSALLEAELDRVESRHAGLGDPRPPAAWVHGLHRPQTDR